MSRYLTTEDLIVLAEQHGDDSEADCEVGDLQELLRAAFSLMTDNQFAAFIELPRVTAVLEGMCVEDPEEIELKYEEG
jgi:hypothetical protein